MRLFASATVLAMALATSAFAQAPAGTPSSPSAPAPESKKDAKGDGGVICRREIPTGSLFAAKVCTTAEQRKAQSGAVRNAQGAMQGAAPVVPN